MKSILLMRWYWTYLYQTKRAYKCQFVKTILCCLNLNSYFKEVCSISMHQRTKKVELQMINCSGVAFILYTKYTKSRKKLLIRFHNHNMNKDNTKSDPHVLVVKWLLLLTSDGIDFSWNYMKWFIIPENSKSGRDVFYSVHDVVQIWYFNQQTSTQEYRI